MEKNLISIINLMNFTWLSCFILTNKGRIRHKSHSSKACSSIRLERRPLKAERRIRFSYTLPI